jgi:hypothetical protein
MDMERKIILKLVHNWLNLIQQNYDFILFSNQFEMKLIEFFWIQPNSVQLKFNENIINRVESKGEEYCVQLILLQFNNLNSIENEFHLMYLNSNQI